MRGAIANLIERILLTGCAIITLFSIWTRKGPIVQREKRHTGDVSLPKMNPPLINALTGSGLKS
ncbi:Cystathionine beta-lyase [Venturia inaequalis]|nr:Cystathionine beta-lyase [Venturia inaequalis]